MRRDKGSEGEKGQDYAENAGRNAHGRWWPEGAGGLEKERRAVDRGGVLRSPGQSARVPAEYETTVVGYVEQSRCLMYRPARCASLRAMARMYASLGRRMNVWR
jgi:hypothetical protein